MPEICALSIHNAALDKYGIYFIGDMNLGICWMNFNLSREYHFNKSNSSQRGRQTCGMLIKHYCFSNDHGFCKDQHLNLVPD